MLLPFLAVGFLAIATASISNEPAELRWRNASRPVLNFNIPRRTPALLGSTISSVSSTITRTPVLEQHQEAPEQALTAMTISTAALSPRGLAPRTFYDRKWPRPTPLPDPNYPWWSHRIEVHQRVFLGDPFDLDMNQDIDTLVGGRIEVYDWRSGLVFQDHLKSRVKTSRLNFDCISDLNSTAELGARLLIRWWNVKRRYEARFEIGRLKWTMLDVQPLMMPRCDMSPWKFDWPKEQVRLPPVSPNRPIAGFLPTHC